MEKEIEEKSKKEIEIKKYLKETLSEKRYNHSIKVMEKAEELAQIYNIDIETARLTGLAHDIAKEMTMEEYEEYANNHNIEITKQDKQIYIILHAKIGADMCKNKFNFSKEMQDAIHYHTTGRKGMSILDKIIYIADKIEDSREYDKVEQLRELAKVDIDETIRIIVDYNITNVINKKKMIHPLSIELRNEIISSK